MALDKDALAKKLWETVRNSAQDKITDEIKAYAAGYVAMLTKGSVMFLPGTITGTGVPNSVSGAPPPMAGSTTLTGVGGKITVVPTDMSDAMVGVGGFKSVAPKVIAEAAAISSYIIATGLVNLPAQSMGTMDPGTGIITPSGAITPGMLTQGSATGGTVTALTGAACLAMVIPAIGGIVGPKQNAFYSALIDYTLQNAEVAFDTATITGNFPDAVNFMLISATNGKIS